MPKSFLFEDIPAVTAKNIFLCYQNNEPIQEYLDCFYKYIEPNLKNISHYSQLNELIERKQVLDYKLNMLNSELNRTGKKLLDILMDSYIQVYLQSNEKEEFLFKLVEQTPTLSVDLIEKHKNFFDVYSSSEKKAEDIDELKNNLLVILKELCVAHLHYSKKDLAKHEALEHNYGIYLYFKNQFGINVHKPPTILTRDKKTIIEVLQNFQDEIIKGSEKCEDLLSQLEIVQTEIYQLIPLILGKKRELRIAIQQLEQQYKTQKDNALAALEPAVYQQGMRESELIEAKENALEQCKEFKYYQEEPQFQQKCCDIMQVLGKDIEPWIIYRIATIPVAKILQYSPGILLTEPDPDLTKLVLDNFSRCCNTTYFEEVVAPKFTQEMIKIYPVIANLDKSKITKLSKEFVKQYLYYALLPNELKAELPKNFHITGARTLGIGKTNTLSKILILKDIFANLAIDKTTEKNTKALKNALANLEIVELEEQKLVKVNDSKLEAVLFAHYQNLKSQLSMITAHAASSSSHA